MTTAGDPNLRHLLARAVAVEQRIRRAVEARQRTDPDPDDAFRGLYLTDENIARLLDEEEARAFPYPVPFSVPDDDDTSAERSRLTSLTGEFGLTTLDIEILLIALVPDLDDRFEAFYGYLNDDVTRRRPSIGLALGLCGLSPADQVARGRLSARAPLREGRLLLAEDLDRPFLSRALRVPDRVTAHLLGDDTPDPRLAELLAPWHAVPGVGDPAPLAAALARGAPLAYLREDQGGSRHGARGLRADPRGPPGPGPGPGATGRGSGPRRGRPLPGPRCPADRRRPCLRTARRGLP